MGKYTVYNQDFIDFSVQAHIDLAVAKIKKRMPQAVSVILVGGFGRAEGSVKICGQNIEPLNDYDMYVIMPRNEKVSEKKADKLMKEIEKEAGTSGFSLYESSKKAYYFDIRFLSRNKLSKLPPFIKYYEMKHSSYIVYGRDIREEIAEYKPHELPLSEGVRFLFNRLSSITLWTPTDLLQNKRVSQWKLDAILYDVSKSYIEICTLLCQMAGVYAPTYTARSVNLIGIYNKKFPELAKQMPDLAKKVSYYTELKLKPNYENINNHLNRWFECRNDILKVLEFALNKIYGANFDNFSAKASNKYFRPYMISILPKFVKPTAVFETTKVALAFLAENYMNLLWLLRLKKFEKKIYLPLAFNLSDPGIKIFHSLLFINGALLKNGQINNKKIKKGIHILQSVFPLKNKQINNLDEYQALVDQYIRAWKLYYFQSL